MNREEFDRRLRESPELAAAVNAFWPTIHQWKYSGRKGIDTVSDGFIAGWDARAALERESDSFIAGWDARAAFERDRRQKGP